MHLFCIFTDCDKHALAGDYCYGHYTQLKKEAKAKLKVKKVTKIPLKSKKQIVKDKALHKVYDIMDNPQELNLYCSGCGGNDPLTHSHLLPRSLFKKHEANPINIRFHCFPCHRIWESLLSVNLLDYSENMERMKTLEPNYVISLAQKQYKYFIDQPEKLNIITPFLDK